MSRAPVFIGAQLRGERHAVADQPCCDALWIPPKPRHGSGFVICDGAGGSVAVAHGAAVGARAAWLALLAVRRELERSRRRPALGALQARFRHVFLHRRRGAPWVNHTVLAGVWDRRGLLLAQVGDSSALVRRGGTWSLAVPPAKGTFANETTFLRGDTPPEAIALRWLPCRSVEAVIGFSDGLEAAFLSPRPGAPEQLEPNGALAELVIRQHRLRRGWRGYPAWLRASLADGAIRQLSDDDRTLVIAA
ncbi:protein phosphatase 2C domain-containing protein [Aphanothece minutissima]|uniref:protein phosphatase 2C domain-containing protein n=1 Tax=Aphanothece minutissima TaxID=543815 RepID=UPI001C634481|nr:protein phosphatase 2C domain-containing protein [Aphanothece minutissima]